MRVAIADDHAFRLLQSFPSGIGYLLKDRVSQVAVLVDAVQRVVAGNVRRIFDKLGLADTPQDNRCVLAVLAFLRA